MKKYLNLLLFVCFVCVATFANAQSRNDVTITTSVYPELAGTTSGDGNYSTGENVTVIAFSSVGWKFDKWTIDGTEVSTMTEFEFLANENLSLTAHFIETEIPPAFTNEFHDLNDNQIPENWELEIKWGNVQIAEGKIMAYKVDAFGGLARKGHLTENVSKIICEWDGNIEPTNSGMAPHIYIDFNDDHFFRLYHQIESWDSTKTFFRYYNGSGQQQIIFENFEAKNIGEHHYQLTIENNEIVYKGWFKNTQELIFEKYIDPATVSSAFSLIHIDKIRFFANSTTSNNNWEDNLSIQVYSNIIDGLMAHYPFNGNANDESGNGHDGINYGATLTNDRFGNESSAYNFDGVDDYMNMGTNINPGKTATFAFWIHPENNNTDQSVISKWTGDYSPPNPPGGTNRKRNYSILINQGQDLNGAFSETNNVPGTQSIVTSIFSDPIDYERWQFFVISVDTDTTKLYHNGILQNEVETTIDSIAESTIPTIIGNNNYLNNNFNGGAFKGMIDDIRVFDRVINESQILQLYQEGGWPLLKADFSASPRQGTAPLTVQFTDESTGNPTSWAWDFDNDGNIDSEEADPIWVYNDPGQYTVCLTISDGTETTTHCDENFIIVTPEYIPVECNELIITNEKYNETENLISKVQDEYGMDYTIADWTDLQAIEDIQSWISCIGIPENQTFMCTRNGDYFYGSSRQYYVHYSSDGNPYPGFLVHDQLGDLYLGSWYGLNMNILAKNTSGFIADFSASPRQGTAPLTVQFTDESTGNPTSWAWDFDNDGNIDSEEQHPEYIYFTQGNYTVSLTVSDGIHTDSKSIDDYILVSEDLQLPTVVTVEPANISQTSAQSGGNVTDDGGAEVTARGICWNTSGTPTIGDNITSDGFGTGAFNSSIIGLSCNTTYFLRGYATNSVGTSYGEEFEFSTLPCNAGPYFETIWTTPFSPMNIYVTKATIDEFNMVAGDEIGLFDVEPGSGNEICVGAAVLTEELIDGAYLLIIASMDDGTGDANGFQAGNEIIYKMYSQIEGLVELLTVTYPYPGYDEVFTALGSATVELEGITVISQTLDFVEGWNLTSMRTIADNLDMLSVFNPLIEDEQLLKVINQDGFSVEHLPFPPPAGQWANSIGNWVMEQGYYVKVNENTSLNITAPPVETPMELPLRFGWNMIGMPCELPQSAQTMLQPLIDDGVILKVLNEQGQAIEHLPFPPPSGQWVFGFSSFNPGEGYYVKAAEESQIYFDCNAEYQDDKGSSFATTNFFVPVYQNNPYMPMNVVLNGIESLNAGDEIGIFDNDRCVGAGVIGQSEFVSIPVSMDDPATDEMDGFVTGNSISVKVWQKDINNLVETNLLHLSGALVFTALETYAGMLDFTTTQLFETSQVEFNISVAPNPFSNHTWVYYSLPEIGSLVFKVFNINGILETTVEVDNHPKTSGRVKFDRNQLQPGSYILQCTFSAKGHTEFVNHKLFIK
jgi:PKD repeat protein